MSGLSVRRDVTTGRRIAKNYGRDLKSNRNRKAWWVTTAYQHDPHQTDGHTFEVCLINVSRIHSAPTWPILAFFSEEAAVEWEKKLRAFARTLDPEDAHKHRVDKYNGDERLGDWLLEQGFSRYNHVWWVPPSTPEGA